MNLKLDSQKIIILVAFSLCAALGTGLGLTIMKNKELESKISIAREEVLANEVTIATLTKDGKELEEKLKTSEETLVEMEAELTATKAALELATYKKKSK
ncbi:hypothetical protein ICN49_09120 [Polynucleobacter sp. MWH-Mekk-B1]|uniref:Uncharacterized protein n=1 Tax=Polynucleobacter aenigmaticus TaxID=1743164 RepID=A0A254PZ32_9BURK|nr:MULTISPECIES: hypothetical protein [Polynucleobacter]MBU3545074.1 hypothetical protein [Polynucleobacter finlandensis]OWS71830.1 hypothetical protein CBI30_05100 [Polynucleobacter aenigmaticus]